MRFAFASDLSDSETRRTGNLGMRLLIVTKRNRLLGFVELEDPRQTMVDEGGDGGDADGGGGDCVERGRRKRRRGGRRRYLISPTSLLSISISLRCIFSVFLVFFFIIYLSGGKNGIYSRYKCVVNTTNGQ